MNKCKYCKKPTKNRLFCDTKCSGKYHGQVNFGPSQMESILRVVAGITGGQLPGGILTDIGKEVGRSRERVRQIAKKMGLIAPHELSRRTQFTCWYCEKLFYPERKNMRFCSMKCRLLYSFYKHNRLRICEQCGLGFVNPTNRSHMHRHFCGRVCQGKSLAEHYGWGTLKNIGGRKSPIDRHVLEMDLGRVFKTEDFVRQYKYASHESGYVALCNLIFKGIIEKTGRKTYRII